MLLRCAILPASAPQRAQKTWSCWCNANGTSSDLNIRVHRYKLSNSDITFTARILVTRHDVAEERFKLRFHEGLFKMIASRRLPATWHEYGALCFTKHSFCGFSTSNVGLCLVQSGVGLRVARRKQLKMCGTYFP